MVNTGAIIQVRLGSERLPSKALLPLPFGSGPCILEHVVRRALAAEGLAKVIVATTNQPVDDAVELFCTKQGIDVFRGSTDNVLQRYVDAAKAHNINIIVRLTGDNPFISPKVVADALRQHLASDADYTHTEGLALGTNIEIVTQNALVRAAEEATEATDREHVTPFIRRNECFKKLTLKLQSSLYPLRLTIDYPSDYALASLLYERLQQGKNLFDFKDIERLLHDNPWLININSFNTQRIAFASEDEEIEEAKKVLRHGGFKRTLQRLNEASDG